MTNAFKKGKAFICQNPDCNIKGKKFYKHGYGHNDMWVDTNKQVMGETLAELTQAISDASADGWRRRGGDEIYQNYNGHHYVWLMREPTQPQFGPFFHSQGCMYQWISQNIEPLYQILLANNRQSDNIPHNQ